MVPYISNSMKVRGTVSSVIGKTEMSTQIVKDGTTDGSKDSFGSGTESSQEFGFYK